MSVNIEVNNRTIKVKRGETILNALLQNGIQVPTLCNMKNFTPTGACRMCIVEIEGIENLVPACSYPVNEWMKIKTHSPRVINARKTILELLLANHPDDCLYCEKNTNCELQNLAEELNVRERRFIGKKNKHSIDQSSAGIVRESAKCILCGRCVRVCEEVMSVSAIEFTARGKNISIDTALSKSLNLSSCIECGQCIMVCPTNSFREKENIDIVLEALHDPGIRVYALYNPAVAATLGEFYGAKSSKYISGTINSILRKIGFEKVFETAFANDIMINETTNELLKRIENNQNLPVISSACPSFVKYIEQFKPHLINNLSVLKNPDQIMGSIIKNYFSKISEIPSNKIFNILITPCVASKYESQHETMTTKGIPDIDIVLTTRELAKLINIHGLDFNNSEEEQSDEPFNIMSYSGVLYQLQGGIIKSVSKTLIYKNNKNEQEFDSLINSKTENGYIENKVLINGRLFSFIAVTGIANALKIIERVEKGEVKYDYIEVLACPNGCLAGGGQPLVSNEQIVKNRIKLLNSLEDKFLIPVPDKNPLIIDIYKKYFNADKSENAYKYLTRSFSKRDVLI
jgi:NADH-quinone oxidoreductase subunit G/NADP-reducing hydrogenase subunit HndD